MKIEQRQNGNLIISPELPPCFDGDMEWDLQDVMFMLEMEEAKHVDTNSGYIYDMNFSFNDKIYNISECDCEELSKGRTVEIEPHIPYYVIG